MNKAFAISIPALENKDPRATAAQIFDDLGWRRLLAEPMPSRSALPPVETSFILAHPAYGVALVDIEPALAEEPVERLERRLRRVGFAADSVPILHFTLTADDVWRIPTIIDPVFALQLPREFPPPGWIGRVQEALLLMPPDPLPAAPEAAPGPVAASEPIAAAEPAAAPEPADPPEAAAPEAAPGPVAVADAAVMPASPQDPPPGPPPLRTPAAIVAPFVAKPPAPPRSAKHPAPRPKAPPPPRPAPQALPAPARRSVSPVWVVLAVGLLSGGAMLQYAGMDTASPSAPVSEGQGQATAPPEPAAAPRLATRETRPEAPDIEAPASEVTPVEAKPGQEPPVQPRRVDTASLSPVILAEPVPEDDALRLDLFAPPAQSLAAAPAASSPPGRMIDQPAPARPAAVAELPVAPAAAPLPTAPRMAAPGAALDTPVPMPARPREASSPPPAPPAAAPRTGVQQVASLAIVASDGAAPARVAPPQAVEPQLAAAPPGEAPRALAAEAAATPPQAAPQAVTAQPSVAASEAAAPPPVVTAQAAPPPPRETPRPLAPQPATPQAPASQAPASQAAAPLDARVINLLIARGDEMLARGDMSAARLLYGRAADAGSAAAALAMARSFDPAVLAGLGVPGLRPDAAAAEHWYRRAAELGAR